MAEARARAADLVAALALYLLAASALAQAAPALTLAKTIRLPGVDGRIDHLAIDVRRGRLFIAALGNDTVEVVDAAAAKRIATLNSVRRPTGVAFVPEANRIWVASSGSGALEVFDGASFELLKTLEGFDDADNLRFDARANRIYLGYGDGALAAIDAATTQRLGRIELAAHPEAFQLEAAGRRVFVNLPAAQRIVAVDREAPAHQQVWGLGALRANFPMALDAADGRLFVGFRDPARLGVFHTATGRRMAELAICGDTDDLFFDSKRKRLYVSCGEGAIDVIEQRGPDRYEERERVPTRAAARTSLFSPETDALYVALPKHGPYAAEIRVYAPH